MGRLDLPEPYAIRQARRNVRESLQSHGEEIILLRMYHVTTDQGTQPRCHCFDDIYQQSADFACPDCYGTTFAGGVKQALRVWALISTITDVEDTKKRGMWAPDNDRTVHFEASLDVSENDYLIRVKRWGPDHRPLELGPRMVLGDVTEESLRTGNQYGQTSEDLVGQRARAHGVSTDHPIHQYPVPDFLPVAGVENRGKVNWWAGHGPPPAYGVVGSRPGDMYLDIDTGTKYQLES